MPLYEYKCLKCGHQFELIRKFSDPPVKKCVKCGGRVEKLMSSSAIAFKGPGWYVTDHGHKKGAAEKEKPGGSEPDASEAKSEPKKDAAGAEKVDKADKADRAEKKGKRKS